MIAHEVTLMVSAQTLSTMSEREWKKYRAAHLRHSNEACAYYRRNKSRFLRNAKYRNKHIAIRDKQVVDVDPDPKVLAYRLMDRFPDHKYYVQQVVKVEPVYHIGDLVVTK